MGYDTRMEYCLFAWLDRFAPYVMALVISLIDNLIYILGSTVVSTGGHCFGLSTAYYILKKCVLGRDSSAISLLTRQYHITRSEKEYPCTRHQRTEQSEAVTLDQLARVAPSTVDNLNVKGLSPKPHTL